MLKVVIATGPKGYSETTGIISLKYYRQCCHGEVDLGVVGGPRKSTEMLVINVCPKQLG